MESGGFKPWLKGLVPRKDPEAVTNPFKIMRSISAQGWLLLISGWLAWTTDGYDYFSVSLTAIRLSEQFYNDSAHVTNITTGITLTLLFRPLGAVIFGILADRFGRKYTLVFNLCLIAVFELATSFVNNFNSFLAVRALFGVAMGGIWGNAASTALENIPVQARGLISGFVQQGYAVGYLIAAVVNLTLVPHNKHTWRSLYWVGAGLSFFAALFRLCLPESQLYLRAKEEEKARGHVSTSAKSKIFFKEVVAMLKTNWIRLIWAVLLMTGMNFFSHGSQDLFPTYLQKSKGFTSQEASRATIISNVGAICGGLVVGYMSQFSGRRVALVCAVLFTAAFIPLWILPSSFGALSAGAFFVQFGVQGAWGVIPIYLSEAAPPAFRALVPGVAYQLGNMISSAAAQIEARGGQNLRTVIKGKNLPDYGKVQGILIGCVIVWLLFFTLIGPEAHGAHFEEGAVGFQEGAGREKPEELVHPEGDDVERGIEDHETQTYDMKPEIDQIERK